MSKIPRIAHTHRSRSLAVWEDELNNHMTLSTAQCATLDAALRNARQRTCPVMHDVNPTKHWCPTRDATYHA